jgi:hypothetical protein
LGFKTAAVAAAVNVVILLLGLLTSRSVFWLGLMIAGVVAVVTAMLRYRRGQRYTGVGLLGGWLAGLLLDFVILALL